MNFEERYRNMADEELVVLALKNKEEYKHLMQRYEEKLIRYISRISGAKKDDAEDILQEVFIKVYKKLNEFDVKLKFSSWIYRIAHNEAVNYLRKSSIRPKIVDSDAGSILIDLIKSDLDMEHDIDEKILEENMAKIIEKLDKKYREVLILKYMEDKDYQEISDILRKPAGTVATLLKRAKDRLKKEIFKNNLYLKNYV